MEYSVIERGPGDIRQPLTPDEIVAVCERAFAPGVDVESARELGGGEFNSVFVIRIAGREPVVLRAAPPPGRDLPWHAADLMRHEHAIQPYLAPIAPLLPTTFMVDFTHQILDRDYLFQSCMPGERWKDIADQLSPEEEESLWRQLARIARDIHGVRGAAFGHPDPGRRSPTWGATVLDWLARCLADAERAGLDTAEMREIRDIAQARADLLDEITIPRLLHGDLWPFNVLIARGTGGPRITAVLDCDRASWGDPAADWTFHLLPRRASERVQASFWDEYGRPEPTPGARFRDRVYEGLHAGNVLSEVRRRGRADLEPGVRATLRAVVADLRAMQ